jgi:hypothetical protein
MSQTPKEKAEELIDKFSERRKLLTETKGWIIHVDSSKAKGHALTAVDEILNINSVDKDFSLSHYWLDVKDEIQNL